MQSGMAARSLINSFLMLFRVGQDSIMCFMSTVLLLWHSNHVGDISFLK